MVIVIKAAFRPLLYHIPTKPTFWVQLILLVVSKVDESQKGKHEIGNEVSVREYELWIIVMAASWQKHLSGTGPREVVP